MHEENTVDRRARWVAPPHPAWLEAMNAEGRCLDLPGVVPLEMDGLVETACRQCGLHDFGTDEWREPLAILCRDLDGEAELTLMGRLMARSDILTWLGSRLQVVDLVRRHPEITEQQIVAPVFIVGLPRSGTSILFEVLASDPAFRVPETWEVLFPCPPPEPATYATDPRIDRAHALVTQWNRVVPEFATMHEMGGRIPAECGLIMAGSFISDHIVSLHQAPNYAAWYASADVTAAYEYHKLMLQVLQWRHPGRHWLLKAPAHQNYLDILLRVYPDARIIQTHRDPIKCMASAASLMGCLYLMRSDKPFDSDAFADFLFGPATAQRLERVMALRRDGVVPETSICDSRFQDLMEDPLGCVRRIYAHFGMSLSSAAETGMQAYLASKPRGKFGVHSYAVAADDVAERRYFRAYQQAYDIPDEV